VPAIAAALSTKPHNITCRISNLRKRYGFNIATSSTTTTTGSSSSRGRVGGATTGAGVKKATALARTNGRANGVGKKKVMVVEDEGMDTEDDIQSHNQEGAGGAKGMQGQGRKVKVPAWALEGEGDEEEVDGEQSEKVITEGVE
jgi:hypothetical protein